MFKVLFIAILVSFYGNSQNFVTISDKNFADFLNEKYPSCMSGNQLDISCSSILKEETLILNSLKIQSIDGIQYFENLKVLECLENDLTSLPQLPGLLIKLDCSMNQLTSLSSLPLSLEELSCALNHLTSLPILPNSLKILYCNFNEISVLPSLPVSLEYLACGSNRITCLPQLPTSIFIGDIALNPLSCVSSYENWMDEESLKIPLCKADEEINNPNRCICISTSILSNDENIETDNSQSISIYPNPTKGNFSIRSNQLIDAIYIMDIKGKIVGENRLIQDEILDSRLLNIDLSELTNGIYFIQLSSGENITTNKVFKTN